MASGLRKKGLFTEVAQDILGPLPGNKKTKKKKDKWYMESDDGREMKTIPIKNPNDMAY